jgi:lysophospholipase
VAHWGDAAPRGTVLLFPGRTEYIEKYGPAARDLLARGYATLTIDWRGQGIAARMQPNRAIGHVACFGDYQHDVAAMVTHARATGLPEPYFLLAHSMGGCIGLRALTDGLPVRAAAFSSPMWGIRFSHAVRPLAWTLAAVSRPLRFSHVLAPGQRSETYVRRATFEGNSLTSDPEMFAFMQRQVTAHPDLALGGASLHWLHESLREMRMLAALPAPDLPCITLLGDHEEIVDPDRIRQRMAAWPGGQLIMVPGGRHETMMEGPAIREILFDAVAACFAAAPPTQHDRRFA